MATKSIDILFPPGRLIMGSLYKGSDKDAKGNPRMVKTGPNKGQPSTQFFQGVAIPKGGEAHWNATAWGQVVWACGAAAFPAYHQNPAFAWKIEDGDSTTPNKSNKRMCDAEGAPGHWIVKFSSSFPPKVYVQGSPGNFQELSQPDAVKNGYWVQVNGSVAGNESDESKGVYVNGGMTLFVKTDAEIRTGPDAATAFAGAAVSGALPENSALPFSRAASAPAPVAAPVAAQAPPVVVMPLPTFLAGPAAVLPGLPALAPPTPALTAAALAGGHTYATLRAAGHTDDALRASGYIF